MAWLLAACGPAVAPQPSATDALPAAPTSTQPAPKPSATGLPAQGPAVEPTQTAIPAPAATLIPYSTPNWFGTAVIYEIFVRSFADASGDGIGDLQGVIERLDYIQSLGANTIWLMPIYPSPSDHGYDVTDYRDVNPDYGSLDDLRRLVEAAHERQMYVILDYVPSHLSNQHPLFQEAYNNPASAHSDWFVWNNDAHTTYAGFAGNETMPRFNHYNAEVVQYLTDAALFWLDLDGDGDMSDGVDGFRVDNATFPPTEFLVALRQAIKNADPEALLLGETWVNNPNDLARFFPDQFDALFDFPVYSLLQGSQDSNGDGLLAGKGFPVLLTTLLEQELDLFANEAYAVRFFANHDTNRAATELSGDPERLRLAAALLGAMPGPVMLYYGEEIGMYGQKGGPPAWDNYRREPLDWYAAEIGPGMPFWFRPEDGWNVPGDGISVEEQDADPNSLLNYYRHVLNTRRSSAALSTGNQTLLELNVSAPGPWGLARLGTPLPVIALFNFGKEESQVGIPEFRFTAEQLVDLLSGEVYPGVQAGQPYTITLAAGGAVWLAATAAP